MKKISLFLLVLFICAGAVSVCEAGARKTPARDYEDAVKTARETMWAAITKGFGSGATVAFTDNGKIVYAEGIGVADRAENRPVDVNTRFNVGSTSKMFAAVAILLLVDDGKVSLDESAAKYIPEFTMKDPRYRDITVRMLFNHSSGLPGSTFYFGYETDDNLHKYVLDTLANSYLKHAPGLMPIYCNDGFTLAEIIVEKVSGEKFLDFLAKRVFKPLGMKNTGASAGEINVKNTAEYYGVQNGKKYPREVVMVYGAGGLSSTASDLCRFANSFSPYGRHILSQNSIREILRIQPSLFSNKLMGPVTPIGFGWDYSSLRDYSEIGIQVLAKSGGTACYNTYIQTAPQYGVTVVFSISGNGINLEAASRPILDAIMRRKNIGIPGPKSIEKPVEPQAIPEELLAYEGYYTNGSVVVKARFDKENKKCDLIPLGAGEPGKDKAAAPLLSMVYNSGFFFCFEKNIRMYFTTIGGESFIAQHEIPRFGIDGIKYKKISELKEPKKLKIDAGGKKWLVRNMIRHVVAGGEMCMFDCVTYPELPGYIDFAGLKKIESPECASIAATAARDQTSFELFDVNGESWVRAGVLIYSMADNARKLILGVNRIVIKSDGYNQWLRVAKGAAVKFEKPAAGARAMIFTEAGVIFDTVVDNEEVFAPEGSFIFFAGKPGDMFRVFAR